MNFCKKENILVVGDAMLDIYFSGKVGRISPEAPVPVFQKRAERSVPGGAANVAVNLAAADQKVSLLAVCGEDTDGETLREKLRSSGVDDSLLLCHQGRTITKTRFVADNHQQMLRMDVEETDEVDDACASNLYEAAKQRIPSFSVVVLSDYLKGLLRPDLTRKIIDLARRNNIPVLVDPKDVRVEKYAGAFLIKPNRKELRELTGLPADSTDEIVAASRKLMKQCGCKYVLTTCGREGMILTSEGGYETIASTAREVYDVSGAGDTVIAYLAAGLASGAEILEVVRLANRAAGLQVGKMGTSPVYLHELQTEDSLRGSLHSKIVNLDAFSEILRNRDNRQVVFTNGCFDLLHIGHVRYLKQAAALGELLIVGINSDASVRRLKGDDRPINKEADRAEVLAALACVDYVTVFDEDTPWELIRMVQPDILVKGGDYRPEDVIGRDIVEARGGRVEIMPFINGYSTSRTLEKIRYIEEKGGRY